MTNLFIKPFQEIAALLGLVPCGFGSTPCSICDLWILADNILYFMLFELAGPILVIALLFGGIIWLTSAGNPGQVTKGKKIVTSSLFGILIAFGSWLIVSTVINTFANGYFTTPWNQIRECPAPLITPSVQPSPGPGAILPPPAPGGTVSDAQARAQLAAQGITVNAAAPQTSLQGMTQATVNEIISLHKQCSGCTVQVTGGTETTGGHKDTGGCTHINGCKFDVAPNTQLNNYISIAYTQIEPPSFGIAQYRAPNGSIYTFETKPPHWDVAVKQ